MRTRMKLGEKKYGADAYLLRTMEEDVKNIEEELVDIANYAYMMHDKIQRFKRRRFSWQKKKNSKSSKS